jgi:hypothetical protein
MAVKVRKEDQKYTRGDERRQFTTTSYLVIVAFAYPVKQPFFEGLFVFAFLD